MLTGAADLFNYIAAEYSKGQESEVISALDKFAASLRVRT